MREETVNARRVQGRGYRRGPIERSVRPTSHVTGYVGVARASSYGYTSHVGYDLLRVLSHLRVYPIFVYYRGAFVGRSRYLAARRALGVAIVYVVHMYFRYVARHVRSYLYYCL